MTPALSLAHSPCPNDTFVFHAWTHGLVPGAPPVTVTFADVDVTNGAAERGEYDVVKVSYAALPWLLNEYALLPAGGALGRGCGPLVLTPAGAGRAGRAGRTGRAGPGSLAGASVAVPGDRTTAYLLFRLWSADAPPARVEVVPFPQIMPAVRDGRYDAGLVIHEARFTYPQYGLECLVDLGAWWEQDTGLPIPLGAILARRTLDQPTRWPGRPAGPAAPGPAGGGTAELTEVIRASVRHAWANPDDSVAYVAAHAAELDPAVQRAHIELYVNEFTADLGEEGYAAAGTLLGRAAAAGLTPPCPPLR